MRIRTFNVDDIVFAAQLTAAEGWSGETSAVFSDFYKFRRDGCFIAEEDGIRIGIVVAVPYGKDGFIGELIVRPEWRGSGRGRALLDHAVAFHTACGVSNICLDGVPAAVPLYERAGFRRICRSLRFTGSLPAGEAGASFPMQQGDLPDVFRLDQEIFGTDRSCFLHRRWLRSPGFCFVHRSEDVLDGFVIAAPGEYLHVGPWVQLFDRSDPDLLFALKTAAAGREIRLGVLEKNEEAVHLLLTLNLQEAPQSPWRMVLGEGGLGESPASMAVGSAAAG